MNKLIIPLKGVRLANPARGSHGGYPLAREPSTITLREIVEILEGDITPVERAKNGAICGRSRSCLARDV
ncbi:MAG: Rrf2 family transcriptional regulator [Spirochaetes bacterium]|nr:Rrf2 family transcriptional regulator [Spirochaetota bacterium]